MRPNPRVLALAAILVLTSGSAQYREPRLDPGDVSVTTEMATTPGPMERLGTADALPHQTRWSYELQAGTLAGLPEGYVLIEVTSGAVAVATGDQRRVLTAGETLLVRADLASTLQVDQRGSARFSLSLVSVGDVMPQPDSMVALAPRRTFARQPTTT